MSKTMSQLEPIKGKWYQVSFHEPTRLMKVTARGSRFSIFLPIISAVDSPTERDVTGPLSDFRVRRQGQTTILTFTEKSSLWQKKQYTVEFHPSQIKYYYKVLGDGPVSRAYFCRSWYKDPTTVEDELGVVPGFDTVFSPGVNFYGKNYHFPGETSIITCGDETMYIGAGLVAAPYCFAFCDRSELDLQPPGKKGAKPPWVWAGLGLKAGQYTFDEFTWNSNQTKRIYGAGGFDLNFAGKMEVRGSWQSPHLVLGIAKGPYEAMEDYVHTLERDYGLQMPRKRRVPTWWRSPIFCGWGEQMSLGYRDHGNIEGINHGVYCTQELHDHWMGILRRHKIRPGVIIIDAGWEKPGTAGDMVVDEGRWPDLRGWIEARRREGIRTMLWCAAWCRLGVPDEERCTKDGKPFNVDPTNEAYEKRLRAMVRRLLSDEPGCYNSDGLKIDGELGCPVGPGLKNRENLWGMELQRRWLGIVYDEAKKHKPDAAIGLYQANPYVADLCDMARTADHFSIRPTPEDTMFHRAKLMSITMPGCPIDTDHNYWYDVRDNWIDIMDAQMKIPGGVPCMYHAEYVWHRRPFVPPYMEKMTDSDYRAVRKAFDAHWKRIGKGR